MSFQIIRADITNLGFPVDAIVNSANHLPLIGTGVDLGIHLAAGEGLLEERKKIGVIPYGGAEATSACGLNASYVIHAIGPLWVDGTKGEEKLLSSCYKNALNKALELQCRSVAFPLISTGNFGFPKDKALTIANREICTFLLEHEMSVYLVVFNSDAVQLSERLQKIVSYITEEAVEEVSREEYRRGHREKYRESYHRLGGAAGGRPSEEARAIYEYDAFEEEIVIRGEPSDDREDDAVPSAPSDAAAPRLILPNGPAGAKSDRGLTGAELLDRIRREELEIRGQSFAERLNDLILRSGKPASEIYKKAFISRQVFSKVSSLSNPQTPSQKTVISLALALELSLSEAEDLMRCAGYSFRPASVFDNLICSCIRHGVYNPIEVNILLFEFDQELLNVG